MRRMFRLLLLPASLLLALAAHAGADTTAPVLKADTTQDKRAIHRSQPMRPVIDTTVKKDTLATSAKKAPLAKKPVVARIPDSIYLSPGGFRVGVDLSRIPVHFFQPYRTDITVQSDVRLNGKWYGALDVGYNRTSHSDTNYTYKGHGYYAAIGGDYDVLKKQYKDELNMVFFGFRYGFAHTSYEVPHYVIRSEYWGTNIPGSVPLTSSNAHWLELVFGMKVEVLPHLFLGWGVREKIMLANSADKVAPPLVIAGFGDGTKKSQFDMNYSISYQVPLYKVKVHVPRPQPQKKRQ
jgi:hypothetical protein